MTLLNGEISGHFGQTTVLDSIEEWNEETQSFLKRKYELKNIIKDLVYTLGGEKLDNIFINDLDELGLKMLKYIGQSNLFIKQKIDPITWQPIEGPNGYTIYHPDFTKLKVNEEWTTGESPEERDFISLPDDLTSFGFSAFNSDSKTEKSILFTENSESEEKFLLYRLNYGDIAGYEPTPMVFNADLIAQAGETITSALDKIVSMLGNSYEYFYDVYGHFIFQKKKTYLDTSWSPMSFYLDGDSFTLKQDSEEFIFEFLDESLISSISINPGIDKVKNDFIVCGQTEKGYPIHLRYSIDKKPTRYISWDWISYYASNEEIGSNVNRPDPTTPSTGSYVDWTAGNENMPTSYQKIYKTKTQVYFSMANWNFDKVNEIKLGPEGKEQPVLMVGRYLKVGDTVHKIIGIENSTLGTRKRILLDDPNNILRTGRYNIFYYTAGQVGDYLEEIQGENYVDWRELIYQMAKDFHAHGQESDYVYQMRLRNPTMFQNGKSGYEQYYTDLMGFWPDVYRYTITIQDEFQKPVEKEIVGWNMEKLADPNTMMYWLEFLEGNSQFDAISVPKIGDRTKVPSNKKATVLFEPNVPPLLYYLKEENEDDTHVPASTLNYSPIHLTKDFETAFSIASFPTAAKTIMEDELNNYTSFTRSVSLTTVPLYGLDVNRKVRINSERLKGQFIINRLTIPLNYNGMMSVSLNEITDSLY